MKRPARRMRSLGALARGAARVAVSVVSVVSVVVSVSVPGGWVAAGPRAHGYPWAPRGPRKRRSQKTPISQVFPTFGHQQTFPSSKNSENTEFEFFFSALLLCDLLFGVVIDIFCFCLLRVC